MSYRVILYHCIFSHMLLCSVVSIYRSIYCMIFININIQTYIHTYVRTYLRTYVRTYIRTYVHTYVHTYICTYVHTYIHIYGMMIYCTVFTCITSYCIGYYYVMLLVHLGLLKTLHLRLGGFGADADVQQHGLRGPPRCVFRSKLSSRWLQNIGRALLIFEGYLWNTVKLQLI